MKLLRSPAAVAALSAAGLMFCTPSAPSAEAAPGGCPAYPAFPNAGCTGVPPGTTLTAGDGDLVVTTIYGFDTGCQYPNNGSCNGTSALIMGNNANGPSSNTTISNNLLAGGAYTLYCPSKSTANFRVVGNHFSTVYSPNVGEYGSSTNCGGVIQSGNVYHESGAPLTLQ